jgi:multidrug efflux pump subunit AcrB
MIHFKSLYQPLIILMMIPLGWLGSSWGHTIEGIPISMLSVWGMVALSGVIINDAVVFLSKYNTNLKEGQPVEEAAYNAGIARFRAILLTTVTTVVGLYPIVLETSRQAEFLKPMAIALAYGVLFGTSFILLFFPALILAMNALKVSIRWLWTGSKPGAESVEVAVINEKIKID